MRTIGIDLGISAAHRAIVVDERGEFITPVLRTTTDPADLAGLLERAQEGNEESEPLQVVMEPTGLSWFPVASYFIQRGVTVYLANTRQVSDLRKFYSKYAKSDRISARVLARLPWVNPDTLKPLQLTSAAHLSGQRWCKQREELAERMTAIKNRIQAWERAFWPGLEKAVGDLFAPWVRRWREACYDPWQLREMATEDLEVLVAEAGADPEKIHGLAVGLKKVACTSTDLFGSPEGGRSQYVDYADLQEQVQREQRLLAFCEDEHRAIRERVRRLYRQLHPSRNLETIQGVGEDGAAVYVFFIGQVERFATQKAFRGWSGMVPRSDQSGETEKKRLRITKSGPNLVKKYAYINAEVARQWDPQIAAIYHDQMVNKGKHHVQAVCCCATHLLDRIRAVLRDDRPYEVQDGDGNTVAWQEARAIIAERYHVGDKVRQRSSHRSQKARRDERAERKEERRSRPEAGKRLTPERHLKHGLTSPHVAILQRAEPDVKLI